MADLVASYQGPAAFYWGFGEDGSGYAMTNYISASYTDLTWKNTSTGATSSVWSYTDPTWMSETPLQAFSTDLTLNYELYGQADCPTLTVSDGAMQAEYSNGDIFQAGLYATADGTNCWELQCLTWAITVPMAICHISVMIMAWTIVRIGSLNSLHTKM